MRIAYFGLPLGALLLAEDGHEIALATLAPVPAVGARRLARRIGDDRILRVDPAGAFAERVTARLGSLEPDLVVSWFWTRRLPARWIEQGRLGGIGVHPSLLPRHRGPNPYFWAIDAGDAMTGVSVHWLTSEYDRGHVLEVRTIPVGQRNAWQLARALDRPSLAALRAAVRRLMRGAAAGEPQDEAAATWAPEPSGDDLRVRWDWSTARILRRIRALSPTPGLALEIRGVPCFVTAATPTDEVLSALLPGEASLARQEPPRVVVRTADGAVALTAGFISSAGDDEDGLPVDGAALARLVFADRVLDSATGGH